MKTPPWCMSPLTCHLCRAQTILTEAYHTLLSLVTYNVVYFKEDVSSLEVSEPFLGNKLEDLKDNVGVKSNYQDGLYIVKKKVCYM